MERHRTHHRHTDEQLLRAFGWMGVAIGVLGLVAPRRLAKMVGLGRRRRAMTRSRVLGVAATASGATVLAALGGRAGAVLTAGGVIDVERTMTIRRPSDELFRKMREPKTLQQIMAHFADVRATTESRQRWTLPLARRSLQWETQLVDEMPGELLHWESVPGASVRSDVWMRFRRAPHDWGTEVILRMRVDPGTALLRSVAMVLGGMIPGLFVSKSLHRFKSLVETGEVPTIQGQPAARNSGRD